VLLPLSFGNRRWGSGHLAARGFHPRHDRKCSHTAAGILHAVVSDMLAIPSVTAVLLDFSPNRRHYRVE
jgi:hypothetical protein